VTLLSDHLEQRLGDILVVKLVGVGDGVDAQQAGVDAHALRLLLLRLWSRGVRHIGLAQPCAGSRWDLNPGRAFFLPEPSRVLRGEP